MSTVVYSYVLTPVLHTYMYLSNCCEMGSASPNSACGSAGAEPIVMVVGILPTLGSDPGCLLWLARQTLLTNANAPSPLDESKFVTLSLSPIVLLLVKMCSWLLVFPAVVIQIALKWEICNFLIVEDEGLIALGYLVGGGCTGENETQS